MTSDAHECTPERLHPWHHMSPEMSPIACPGCGMKQPRPRPRMSHEETAREIASEADLAPALLGEREWLRDTILTALRAVERETLERAAGVLDTLRSLVFDEQDVEEVARSCYRYGAERIRAMKEATDAE